MLGRLRLPGGSRIPSRDNAEEILSVANTAVWTMEMVTRTSKGGAIESYTTKGKKFIGQMSQEKVRVTELYQSKLSFPI